MESLTPVKPVPICDAVSGILSDGHLSIRAVSIDPLDALRNSLLLRDDYAGLFEKDPTIDEIRSTLRDIANRTITNEEGNKFVDILIQNEVISAQWEAPLPFKIGRVAKGTATTPTFGYTALGNSIDHRGKIFK